ncbi:MAG: hypothetical protein KF729_37650 [Sandaracinaceae bacterium]|nr:hypothetical protein [Sandaracinaceae bacterium]
MTEDHALWEAIGNLHRTRRDLIAQLAHVVREEGEHACSFCHAEPPDVTVLVGPGVAICDRCVELCREILSLGAQGRR